MKRVPKLVLALVLLLSVFSTAVYAEDADSEIGVTKSEFSATPEDGVETGGLHVSVAHDINTNSSSAYIPSFDLELWDVAKDEMISEVTAGEVNYNREKREYNLVFNHEGYKVGDEFALVLRQLDEILDGIRFDITDVTPDGKVIQTEYELESNTHFSFVVKPFTYWVGEENHEEERVGIEGSSLSPLKGFALQGEPKIILYLEGSNGQPIVNTALTITLFQNEGSFEVVSDSKGRVLINPEEVTNSFQLSSKDMVFEASGNKRLVVDKPTQLILGDSGVYTRKIVIDRVVEKTTTLVVESTTGSNTDLSTAWSNSELTFTSEENGSFTYPISLGSTSIEGLPEGIYTVSVTESEEVEVGLESNQVTVGTEEGSLGVTLEPKYTLGISKDGSTYDFTFDNVASLSDKTYTGTSETVFAVTPGESYMIRDNSTNNITTVSIEKGSPKTSVVLGAGVVFGGGAVTTPHTGDPIIYLVVLLVLAVAGAGLFFVLYRRSAKNKSLAKTALSLLLVISLTLPILPAQEAHASLTTGGSEAQTGIPRDLNVAGAFQVSNTVSMLRVGFLPKNGWADWHYDPIDGEEMSSDLESSSTIESLSNPEKYEKVYEDLMFYIAPNKTFDDILRRPSTAILGYDRSQSVYPFQQYNDTNPLYTGLLCGGCYPKEDFDSRLLPYAGSASEVRDGAFAFVMSEILYNLDQNNNMRTISGINGEYPLGESVKEQMDYYISHTAETEVHQWNTAVFARSYIDAVMERVDKGSPEYNAAFERFLVDKFVNGEMTFFAETFVAITINDPNVNPLNRDHAFISLHDATSWYLYIRQTARPHDTVLAGLIPEQQHKAVALGGSSTTAMGASEPYLSHGNLPFSFRAFSDDYYSRTLKPVTDLVVMSEDYRINPFGGWGFYSLGPINFQDQDTTPQIAANMEITVIDNEGKPTGKEFNVWVNGWSPDDQRLLSEQSLAEIENGLYVIDIETNEYYKLVGDGTVHLRDVIDLEDNLNKSVMREDVEGRPITIPVPVPEEDYWYFNMGLHLDSSVEDINAYLGGSTIGGVENKYKDHPEYRYSHALLTFQFTAEPVSTSTRGDSTGYTVPEWSLSTYWNSVTDSEVQRANFLMSLPMSTGYDAQLRPSGSLRFSLNAVDHSSIPWFYSKPKLFNGDSQSKYIGVYSTFASFDLAGDLLAVKANNGISPTRFASWVNNRSLMGVIESTDQGVRGGGSTSRSHTFEYSVKAPTNSFRYSETRYTTCGVFPDLWRCPYTFSSTVTPHYTTVGYETNVSFEQYDPMTGLTAKVLPEVNESKNGLYWETKQAGSSILVNPEVLMSHDDTSGNTSYSYVAGSELREIRPVAYNKAQYINVDVNPELTGMSTATDSSAKTLATSKAPNKEVVYKGSAVTTDFEVNGQLELKTFALDIGSSALKNRWNPSTTYNTDDINEEFLSRHATRDASGSWQVTLNAEGKIVIGDAPNSSEYGGKTDRLVATQSNETMITHILEIRGGQLVGVNGNRNLDSLPQELREALAKMGVLGTDNIFNTFERNQGAALQDEDFARRGNAMRGTTNLAEGQGWYNEDTTVLVVREYINTFDLPNYLYVDKIPMEVDGLDTPIDKNDFFSDGKRGYLKLTYRVNDAYMVADSSTGEFGIANTPQYTVPNVSILDTFN